MVSTRHHPRNYPPPDTPSKSLDDGASTISTRSTRSTRGKSRTRVSEATFEQPESPSTAVAKTTRPRGRSSKPTSASTSTSGPWQHTPSHFVLIWLAFSLPLVIWDTIYIFLRPHSFPGGWAHSPIYSPYKLYYETDYIYGQLAWDEHNGFTAAQGFQNIYETAMYVAYLYIVYKYGEEQEARRVTRSGRSKAKIEGRGASTGIVGQWLGEARVVDGLVGGVASLLGFAVSVMTWHKTILYGLNEHFSGYKHVGHNSWSTLIPLYILPNGLWIIFPSYMIYIFGAEILEGLAVASGASVPEVLETKEE